MTERGVVHTVVDRQGYVGGPAHGDVTFTVGGWSAGDEGVREHHRAGVGTFGQVGTDQLHGVSDRGGVSTLGQPPVVAGDLRFQVGDAVEGDRAVLVVDDHRGPHTDRKSTRLNSSHVSISYAGF